MSDFTDNSVLMILEVPSSLKHHFQTVSAKDARQWIVDRYEEPLRYGPYDEAGIIARYVEIVLEDLSDECQYRFNRWSSDQKIWVEIDVQYSLGPLNRGNFSSAEVTAAQAIVMEEALNFIDDHLKQF